MTTMNRRLACCMSLWPLILLPCVGGPAWGEVEGNQAASSTGQQFPVSPGQRVVFDLDAGGSVAVTGWDQPMARVSYQQQGRGDQQQVEIKKTDQGLRVRSWVPGGGGSSRALSFQVQVPRQFDVELHSMGGMLMLVNLEGSFSGTTMGGSLTLRNVSGTVDLKTMGGAIEVTDAELDGTLSTNGGQVVLQNVVGGVDATSMGGNVRYLNVRARDGKPRAPLGMSAGGGDESTVLISTMGGSIEVDEAPAGANVHTMGGDIRVKRANGFVDAQTMGGDIVIDVAEGWVRATTMAGNVTVTVEKGLGDTEKGVDLSSLSGDVTLTVPKGLSMDLDLTIGYTRNSSQDYRITSDVAVEEERSEHWDYSNGSPRKRIHAAAKVAGGRYPIRIETINGNIHLKVAD